MKMVILYADNNDKKKRMLTVIRMNPGVTVHDLDRLLSISHKVCRDIRDQLVSSGEITVEHAEHGAYRHYAITMG